MSDGYEKVIELSYSWFATHPVTPDNIREFIGRAKGFYPDVKIDDKELFNRIEAIHSVTLVEDIRILEDRAGHEEWFNPQMNLPLSRDFRWHFWDHYSQYLLHRKQWTRTTVDALDRFSSLVLCRLEDPLRPGPWDRRGMVVGSVQSGKTAHYTALITKAADAGYKLFVILAGVHNSLRAQTQARLNEEFLGYHLDVVQKITGQEKRIGVRLMFVHDHRVVNTLTSSAEAGDFKTVIARNAGIIPSMTGDPIILIVKKNVTILKNIIEWSTWLGETDKSGRKVVRDIPFLLIDDECDYASVNTKKPERDGNGNIMQEWDPATTNRLIRQLILSFQKTIYVGYTATPYANIFIHGDDPHPSYGDDIFPKHFLVSLPPSPHYIGPEEVFGLKADPDAGTTETKPLPLVREVYDNEDFIPSRHKSDLEVGSLPESLEEALKAFLLVCATRRVRSTGTPHNSMLIHVTRLNNVQSQVKDRVEEEVRALTARIMSGTDPLFDFKKIWEEDFVPTSREMSKTGFRDAQVHRWQDIRAELYSAARMVRIRGINGKAGDTLDYRQADRRTRARIEKGEIVPWHGRGVTEIAIGGDKLSRGLTLEGLSVSYYLRSAHMYDTLMQMGRWFGYRVGYNDLCRLYTTEELIEWYRHIALANRELSDAFDYMEAVDSTPEKFGLRVRSHPGQLAVTSAGKSRAAQKITVTFAADLKQSIVFDPRSSPANMAALTRLVNDIGRKPDSTGDLARPRLQWRNVDTAAVVRFLQSYRIHQDARVVMDPGRIAEYILKQVPRGELTSWVVVIVSNHEREKTDQVSVAEYRVRCVKRSPNRVAADKISIGVLTNPADEALDLSKEELDYARTLTKRPLKPDALPSGPAIREARPPQRGLLLIYFPENPVKDDHGQPSKDSYGMPGSEVVGFAVSFPGSKNAEPIEYVVNSVYAEEAGY